MSIKGKFKRFFDLENEYTQTEVEINEDSDIETAQKFSSDKDKKNVVSLTSIQNQAKVMLLEPHSYDEVQEIADHLKNRKSVVINLQRLPHEQAKRIVDFVSGTVYAIGGDIQKLGVNIFLCTPDNVNVTGAISDMIHE